MKMRSIWILIIMMIFSAFFIGMALNAGADNIVEPTEKVVSEVVPRKLEVVLVYPEEVSEEEEVPPTYLIDVTQEDIDLMARVVMSECSVYLSTEMGTDVAQAIAQTIVNRVRNGRWGTTVSEVVNYPNAYSTADNGEPTKACYKAVYASLKYEGFPTNMYYFREGRYHDFGTEYTNIGNTYFSLGD